MNPVAITLKNGSETIIRRARKGDESGYAAASNQCYTETRYLSRCAEDDFPTAEDLLYFIEDVAESDKEALLVAVCDGHITGFGDITACLNKRKMLHKCTLNISVVKAYWGLGVGKALMESLISFAQNAGYEQIDLSVASDNQRAIGMYECFGFQATGRELHAMKHADGDYSDFVLMTKLLI